MDSPGEAATQPPRAAQAGRPSRQDVEIWVRRGLMLAWLVVAVAMALRGGHPTWPGRGGRDTPDEWVSVFGWPAPVWLAVAFGAVQLATLVLLMNGPQPWRATRWAWGWLWLTPFGTPAFLLLGGAGGPVGPPRPGARRLTGGWGFLLSLVLGQSWFWTG